MSFFEFSCCFHIWGWSHCLGGWAERCCHPRPREEGLVAKAWHNLSTQSLFLYLSQGVKSIGLSKVSKQNRLEEFLAVHNFVDTGWRKLGAFLLRALRVYIRGIRTVDEVSKSTPNHVIPSFFFFPLLSSSWKYFHSFVSILSNHFVHEYWNKICWNYGNPPPFSFPNANSSVNILSNILCMDIWNLMCMKSCSRHVKI